MKLNPDTFQRDVILANYTSMKVGGPAKYLKEAKNERELLAALRLSKELALPFLVIGMGSNLIFSDNGFPGLVIVDRMVGIERTAGGLQALAGTPLAALVNYAATNSLAGLEKFAGIPGTVGGAIYGNAGPRDYWIDKPLSRVRYYDPAVDKIKEINKEEIGFAYRDSDFKRNKGVIISAVFSLTTGQKDKLQEEIKRQLWQRKNKQPLQFPSSGSVFKNPEGYHVGEMIEKCGLKGYSIGNAQVSEQHANFIINKGNALALDVFNLARHVKNTVYENYGVTLEAENIFIGFKEQL